MKVDFFCPRWGFEDIDWETFLENVKSAGYSGIEWFPFGESADLTKVIGLLKKYDLQFCIVMTVVGGHLTFEEYLLQLKKQLTVLTQIGKGFLKPLFISAQTGREYFTATQVDQCIACCNEVSKINNIPIYQETHRNKWSFAAHVITPALHRNPALLLTLDVSHWFCVSESYLEDQQEAVVLAIRHSRHIHARIGHTQGPQVTDPALPQYAEALDAHLKIWDRWIKDRKKSGDEVCTITPEFGPAPYLITTSDNKNTEHQVQWNLNLWIKQLLDKRYNSV
jgi:sugar phosphate isomerase/epimerase